MGSHVIVEVLIVGQGAVGVLGGGLGVGAGDELFDDGRDGLELLGAPATEGAGAGRGPRRTPLAMMRPRVDSLNWRPSRTAASRGTSGTADYRRWDSS